MASADLELDGRKLVEFYVACFQIEFLFRDSKQFTGLAACQARAEAALDFHFNASLATLNLAQVEELQTQTGPNPQVSRWRVGNSVSSMNACSIYLWRGSLWTPLRYKITSPMMNDELRTYGAIAA